MRHARLQDRISWASNVCARAAGEWADAYRTFGASAPLAAANQFLRIPALFTGMLGKFVRPQGYGDALAHGIFDYAYTKPGDYLVQGTRPGSLRRRVVCFQRSACEPIELYPLPAR